MVISREVAEKEITSWLDKKKVFPKEREDKLEFIDQLIEAMSQGVLSLDPNTFEFTHKLLVPSESESPITELKYLPRINSKMQETNLRGVKTGDGDARFEALIATLTKQNRAIISALDTSDKKIAMAIGIFFL